MAHVTIAQRDLDSAKSLLTQLLKDNVPDIDWNNLSVFHDTLIKGASYVVALVFAENRKARNLSDPAYLARHEDEEAREAAELLFSRLFHTRQSGKHSRGTARIYLDEPVDVLVSDRVMLLRGTRRFRADTTTPYIVQASSLNTRFGEDGNPVDYYFDVAVAADQPGAIEVIDGAFTAWENLPASTVRAVVVEPITGGGDSESNAHYVASAGQALHKSGFSASQRGIARHIRERFPGATNEVRVFGAGDPEMRRDWVEQFQAHVLGHTDVYCFQDVVSAEQTLPVVLVTEGETIGGASSFLRARLPQVPTHRLTVEGYTRVNRPLNDSGLFDQALLGVDEFFVVSDPLTEGSILQEKYAYFHPDAVFAGDEVTVAYRTPSMFTPIAEEARSREHRDSSSNILIRAPHPVYLAMTVTYRIGDTRARSLVTEARKALVDYINAASEPIDHTDVAHFLKSNYPSLAKSVDSPFDIECRLYLPNGDFHDYATPSSVELELSDVEGAADMGVSERTVQYLTTFEDVVLVEA